MGLIILNKILLLILILSLLNVFRNLFFFILDWNKEDDSNTKIKMTPLGLLLLGLSLSYVIMTIISGVSINL